jgi:hypothetical protein
LPSSKENFRQRVVPAIRQLVQEQAIYAVNSKLCRKSLTKMRLGYGNRVVEQLCDNTPVVCSSGRSRLWPILLQKWTCATKSVHGGRASRRPARPRLEEMLQNSTLSSERRLLALAWRIAAPTGLKNGRVENRRELYRLVNRVRGCPAPFTIILTY